MTRNKKTKRRSQGGFWRRAFVAGLVGCFMALVAKAVLSEIVSRATWVTAYGIAAAVFLLLVSLYGVRRRLAWLAARIPIGSVRSWLYLHLYGGVLFILLVFMHSDFSVPTGKVTLWLWLLSIWTVLSGFFGLALQQWLPRVLGAGLETEVLYERIPELVAEIREKAETLVEASSDPVKALYSRRLAPVLASPHRRLMFFLDIGGGESNSLREIEFLRQKMPAEEKLRLDQLARLVATKREIDAQYTVQGPLRWWLFTHVPLSMVVWALLILHVFAVLYY